MAELRVVFTGLEKDAETVIRGRLLTFLQSEADHVETAWFGGSGGGSPNFDIDDVKSGVDSSAKATEPATPPATEPIGDLPPAADTLPPAPVTVGIDPETLGSPGPSL